MINSLEYTIHQQKMEIQHYKQQAQQANDRMLKLQAECTAERERDITKVEQESKEVEDLKERINKLESEKHNMEILLDVYKGVPKEQRDRAQVTTYYYTHTCKHTYFCLSGDHPSSDPPKPMDTLIY